MAVVIARYEQSLFLNNIKNEIASTDEESILHDGNTSIAVHLSIYF